ncbi:MAG: beta-lactamase family protein, partial [Candidatus Krumholzibacteriota bacterium]|nr:beta-lactamase family protein [Candidatus Krumholzibacteriota bacterium]
MARDHHSLMLLAMLASTVSMAAVCGAPPGAAGAPGLSREAIASVLDGLPARVEASRQQDRLVGLSLAIVLDGEIVYRGAFGLADVENGRPATAATIYPVASVTKLFTATMLAQMCERGRVGLEDPLQRYLPECRPAPPFPGMPPTTLRQLAAHTAGLPRDAAVNF